MTEVGLSNTPMDVDAGFVRLELGGLAIVVDGILVLAKLNLCVAPIEVGAGMVGLQAETEGLIQVSDV